MAATTDKFMKTGASTVTTLSAPGKALAATSLTVGSTTNYPTDTGVVIAIRVVDSAGELVAGTYTEWLATVTSGTTLAIDASPVYGTDQVYAAGSTTQVFIPLSSYAHNRLIDGVLVHSDQDGTLKAGAVDNAAVLASDVVTTAKILDANVTTAKIADAAVTSRKLAPTYGTSPSSSAYTLTATSADIPSATVDVTLATDGVIFIHYFASLFVNQTAGTLTLNIGGSNVSSAIVQNPAADSTAITASKSYYHVASAGNYTIKLMANRGAGGSGSISAGTAGFTYLAFSQ